VFLADRVGQFDRGPGSTLLGDAERVVGGLGDKRVGQDFGQPGVRQGLDEPTALLLHAGQATSRRGHRKGGGDVVVAHQPCDFLGEVLFGFQVVAPTGGGNRPAAVGLFHHGAEVLQRGDDLFLGEVDADPLGGEGRWQGGW